jgi:hypothetical protein
MVGTDYKSTDTAATRANFLLRVTAANLQVCTFLRSLSPSSDKHKMLVKMAEQM